MRIVKKEGYLGNRREGSRRRSCGRLSLRLISMAGGRHRQSGQQFRKMAFTGAKRKAMRLRVVSTFSIYSFTPGVKGISVGRVRFGREKPNSREFRSKRIFTLKLGGMCWHHFLTRVEIKKRKNMTGPQKILGRGKQSARAGDGQIGRRTNSGIGRRSKDGRKAARRKYARKGNKSEVGRR